MWVAPEIFESSGFMDALSSTDVVPGRRKRKIFTLQAVKSNTGTAAVVPLSPDDKKPQPPSVCKFMVLFSICYIISCGALYQIEQA